jgi:hypothetical protein
MSNQWGRSEDFGWPSDKPVWTYSTFLVALLLALFCLWFTYEQLTSLQQYWLLTYVSANSRQKFGIGSSNYRLLLVEDPDRSYRLASADDVEPTAARTGDRRIPFVLKKSAEDQGKRLLLLQPKLYQNETISNLLRDQVYDGYDLGNMAQPSLFVGLVFLIIGLIVALPKDKDRARVRKYGRRIRGPEEVTAAEFNRRNDSAGMAFTTLEKPSFAERLLRRDGSCVCVPQALEDSHFLFMGDCGSGKSALIRQILLQISERKQSAVVYDPALEYTGQFYTPERGDVILNPLDQRMPYWSPSDEVIQPSEALTLAASLFQDTDKENPFFVHGPRKIFAHLLTLKPTPSDLLCWLSDETELERKLKGTPLAAMIYQNAGPQRGGIFGSLGMVADSLKFLPARAETQATWTAANWSQQRRGWVFVTSTPETREQLRPLISMWLDILILRLMNQGRPGPVPVWFVLDELASLHRLPQLHTAITENRKSHNPVVLCMQGRSQLESIYGHQAEAMFSQPATKIFLKTSEANSAQWISNMIGQAELERLRETRTQGQMPQQRDSRSYQLDQFVQPLIMKEEIAGLDAGHGFFKCGNLVVRISFPYVSLQQKHPHFLERKPPSFDAGMVSQTPPEPEPSSVAPPPSESSDDDQALPQERQPQNQTGFLK